ncbi:MAG: tetratricopeptide repeat protein [Terriglobales bacterium]
MKFRSPGSSRRYGTEVAAIVLMLLCLLCQAQVPSSRPQAPNAGVTPPESATASTVPQADETQAEDELRKGTALTRQGLFTEAIPHLLAARGRVANEYAASFNLALCYVGSGDYKKAIPLLDDLRQQGHENADVENLLAQAYVGNGQPKEALASLEKAAKISPQNEKLYLFVSDACTEHQNYALALEVVAAGLRYLPQSPRLHYQRGMILANLDEFDRAKEDFALVSKLAAGSEIGYVSAAQKELFEGNISGAVQAAREGVSKGFESPILLTILGEALLRSGASPGQPEFDEAQTALEKAVALRPSDPSTQIAIGRLYLIAGRSAEAIVHLEKARQMQPDRPVVYANLAKAYQHHGDEQAAQQALATLEKLNLARAEQIRNAPGERKMSYGGGEIKNEENSPHQ